MGSQGKKVGLNSAYSLSNGNFYFCHLISLSPPVVIRELLESQDAMEQMDRRSVVGQLLMKMPRNTFEKTPNVKSSSFRVKLVISEPPAAKET